VIDVDKVTLEHGEAGIAFDLCQVEIMDVYVIGNTLHSEGPVIDTSTNGRMAGSGVKGEERMGAVGHDGDEPHRPPFKLFKRGIGQVRNDLGTDERIVDTDKEVQLGLRAFKGAEYTAERTHPLDLVIHTPLESRMMILLPNQVHTSEECCAAVDDYIDEIFVTVSKK